MPWPPLCSQILRSTPASARASHQRLHCSGLTFQSLRPLDDEDAGSDVLRAVEVVARRPEGVVVSGDAVLRRLDRRDLVGARAGRARLAGDVARQDVGVLALVAAGGDDEAVLAVVAVPVADGHDGDDRLEVGDLVAVGRELVGDRAVVAGAGHADLAGGPVGVDRVAAADGVEGRRPGRRASRRRPWRCGSRRRHRWSGSRSTAPSRRSAPAPPRSRAARSSRRASRAGSRRPRRRDSSADGCPGSAEGAPAQLDCGSRTGSRSAW